MFSTQNVSEVFLLGPVFGFRTSFSFNKKNKILKKIFKTSVKTATSQ